MNSTFYFILIPLFFTSTFLFSQEGQPPPGTLSGSKIYKKHCTVCHRNNGLGKGKRIPPLAQSDFLQNNIAESIKAIKYGLEGEIIVNGITYDKVMQPIQLSDQEIADVMNFILNSWGNTSENEITTEVVAELAKE